MSATPRPLRVVPADPSGGPLLTIPQLVALLAEHEMVVSERQVYRYLEAGIIPSKRPNGERGAYLVHRAEVLDWIEHGDTNRRHEVGPALTADVLTAAIAEGIRQAFVLTIRR